MELKDNETIGLKSVIVKYLLHWKLFVGAFCFSTILAIIYLTCFPRTYEVVARILIQEDKSLGSGSAGLGEAAGLMKSFGLGGSSGGAINIEDELMTLTSNSLLTKVALDLGVNVEYSKPFTSWYHLYDETPFKMTTDSITNVHLTENVEFSVSMSKGNIEVKVESNNIGKKHFNFKSLPAVIELPMGKFTLALAAGFESVTSAEINIVYHPATWVAEKMAEEFLIEEKSKTSNVIMLSYSDYDRKRAVDMLNSLLCLYNQQSDIYKKDVAQKTLDFYDGRILNITTELSNIEGQIKNYKDKTQMIDAEREVENYVGQMRELQMKLIELESQKNIIGIMDTFVKDTTNKYNLVPMLLFAQEGEKGSPIAAYNRILLERARVIQNSSVNNPLVTTLSKQADELRASVFRTINNAQNSLEMSIADLIKKKDFIYEKMNRFPEVERNYVDLKRQQEIIQGVYLVLLQKREEAALILGRSNEKAHILDSPYVKSRPVGPRKLYALLGVLALTLLLPIIYLFVREQYVLLKKEFLRMSCK